MTNHEHSHSSKEKDVDSKTSKKIGNKTLGVTRKLLIGAGIAVAVAGGATALYFNYAPNSTPDSQQHQQSTQEETEEQRAARQKAEDEKILAAEKSFEERVQDAELGTDLSPEEFEKEYYQTLTDWLNAGADDALEAKIRSGKTIDDIALDNANIYAEALFGKEWASDKSAEGIAKGNFYLKFKYYNTLVMEANKESRDSESDTKYKAWIEPFKDMRQAGSDYAVGVDFIDNSTESGASAELPGHATIYVGYKSENGKTLLKNSNIHLNLRRE